jgi:hypothetical protein
MIRVDHLTKRYGREVTMSTQQSINHGAGPLARAARLGLWALPVWAALLFAGTISHQPSPTTDLAGWSRYVTTPQFLASHLVASILGVAIGALAMVALGAVLASRGHPRAGLWAMVTGVLANVLTAAGFGIAAFAQPAIGRDYLAGPARPGHPSRAHRAWCAHQPAPQAAGRPGPSTAASAANRPGRGRHAERRRHEGTTEMPVRCGTDNHVGRPGRAPNRRIRFAR